MAIRNWMSPLAYPPAPKIVYICPVCLHRLVVPADDPITLEGTPLCFQTVRCGRMVFSKEK